MDLSTLSDADLKALSSGNLAAMSDAGFATLVKAKERATPMAEKQARQIARDRVTYSPTSGMTGPQLFTAAAGKSVADLGQGVSQILGRTTRDEVAATREQDAPLMATGAGKAGYLTGAGAQGLLMAGLPGAGRVLGSAAYGAGIGALAPVAGEESRLGNAALGGGIGAGATIATKAVTGLLRPSATQEAQRLLTAGVPLTPGQQMGGALQRAEEAATSIPVLGDTIKSAMRRSTEGFNSAVANRALAPIGKTLPKGMSGNDAVAFTESAIGDVYESALKKAGTLRADQQMAGDIASLRAMVRNSPMPAEVKSQFDSVIQNQITGKLQGQSSMTAQTFKDAESELGRLAAKYSGDASADKQLLGDALLEAQDVMRRWLGRAAPPDVAPQVASANKAWAEFKRMQRAAASQSTTDGVFSAEQYRGAVRALDQSKDKGAFARGSALGQELANDAVKTIGKTVPDSGTPFRTLMTHPVQGSVAGLLGIIPEAMYSSPRAMSAVQTLLSGQRPALATKAAADLEALKPYLTMLGASGALAYRQAGR